MSACCIGANLEICSSGTFVVKKEDIHLVFSYSHSMTLDFALIISSSNIIITLILRTTTTHKLVSILTTLNTCSHAQHKKGGHFEPKWGQAETLTSSDHFSEQLLKMIEVGHVMCY